jgi:hypothetical protein
MSDYDISSRKFPALGRRKFNRLKDRPALIKMARLLANNKDMHIHSAALLASSCTTGPSAPSIARRLVKRLKLEYRDLFGQLETLPSISQKDLIVLMKATDSYAKEIEEFYSVFVQISRPARELILNELELVIWLVDIRVLFNGAFFALLIQRPDISRLMSS